MSGFSRVYSGNEFHDADLLVWGRLFSQMRIQILQLKKYESGWILASSIKLLLQNGIAIVSFLVAAMVDNIVRSKMVH